MKGNKTGIDGMFEDKLPITFQKERKKLQFVSVTTVRDRNDVISIAPKSIHICFRGILRTKVWPHASDDSRTGDQILHDDVYRFPFWISNLFTNCALSAYHRKVTLS